MYSVPRGIYIRTKKSGQKPLDLSNKRFGNLIAVKISGKNKWGQNVWECYCDCGKIHQANASSLKFKTIQSCGCRSQFRESVKERFFKKIMKTESCWEWTGNRTVAGYGTLSVRKVQNYAHRLSWEFLNGKIPEKMCICHTCDNPGCVNPEHLFLGTKKDNSDDMVSKKRNKFGSLCAASKLNEYQATEVRRLYSLGGFTYKYLSKRFGVSSSVIRKIIMRHMWKHV